MYVVLKPVEVWNITLKMLSDKYLKAKAAETHGLLGFCVEMLLKHANFLLSGNPGSTQPVLFDLLLCAGRAALKFDAILAGHERSVDESTCQQLFDEYNAFICISARAGVPVLPKAHLMYHLLQRSLTKGNPRMYTTYVDESYNGVIARVCRSVHRKGWALAVYRKLDMMQAMGVGNALDD